MKVTLLSPTLSGNIIVTLDRFIDFAPPESPFIVFYGALSVYPPSPLSLSLASVFRRRRLSQQRMVADVSGWL
jgi:hypothetical protein